MFTASFGTLGMLHLYAIFGNVFVLCFILCRFLSNLLKNWIESWLIQMCRGLPTQKSKIKIFWYVEMWGSGISAWFLFVTTTIQCVCSISHTRKYRAVYHYIWSIAYLDLYSNPPLVLYRVGKHWFIPIYTQDYVMLGTYKNIWGIEYFTIGVI